MTTTPASRPDPDSDAARTRTETQTREFLMEALRRLKAANQRLDDIERDRHEPVSVLGMGLRLPGSITTADEYWSTLLTGADVVEPQRTPADGRRDSAQDSDAQHRGGALDQVDGFDAEFFGITAAEASRMDPQQRLVLEVTWEAIADAGIPVDRLRGTSTGVYLRIFGNDYLGMQLSDPDRITTYTGPGAAHSIAANRLSYLLDLHGPSLAVDTACSSSLVALHLAVQGLRSGDCDFALVAGVNLILSELSTDITGKVLPMAPGGRCRSFDDAADGIVRSEGCVVLLLARAGDGAVAGYHPRAEVLGTAVNQDGRTNGLTAPNPASQRKVLTRALSDAGVAPEKVVYVEAHGTGTALGDPLEVEAIRAVYGAGSAPCALGSVKANMGHLEAAAGLAGLAKAILVLEHRQAPPIAGLERLNREIDLEGSRLVVPAEPMQLDLNGPAAPYAAAVSSFGFGGTNAHVVLGGVQRAQTASAAPPRLILPLSARTPNALQELAERYAHLLQDSDADGAGAVCAAAAHTRDDFEVRRVFAAPDVHGLLGQLRAPSISMARPAKRGPRIAFAFGGQGSQWAGMARDLREIGAEGWTELSACAEEIRALTGWSLVEWLDSGASEGLDDTEFAQPAIVAIQLAIVAHLRAAGVKPAAVIGHSLGEVAAAHVAGAFDRATAFGLLVRRAKLSAPARGGVMATIELPAGQVEQLLIGLPDIGIAAINDATATVVSGSGASVDRVLAAAVDLGARTKRLPVDYAFHSPLLSDAGEQLVWAAADLVAVDGGLPFYSTVSGRRMPTGKLDAAYWGANLRDPVLFHAAITSLAADGFDLVVEIGPHPVLQRYIAAVEDLTTIATLHRHRSSVQCLHDAVSALYEAGVDVDWTPMIVPPDVRVDLPHYPWQRRRYWLPERRGASRLDRSATSTSTDVLVAQDCSTAERLTLVTDYLHDLIADMLQIDVVDLEAPLTELGLDSVAVVALKTRAERDLGVTVSLAALLRGGTGRELAQRLVNPDSIPEPPDPARTDALDPAALLARLDGLSEAEVAAALDALTPIDR